METIKVKNGSTTKMLLKQIGSLQIVLGVLMVVPTAVSAIYSEYYSTLGFLISSVGILLLGFSLYLGFNNSPEPLYKHAYIIAALGWLSIAVMGAIPFIVIAYITPFDVQQHFVPAGETYLSSLANFRNPLHAFFESMSGFTTTGFTMAVHEPSIGKGLLFYRSFSSWIGGAGFIVLALAVIRPATGKTALLLYGSESCGERLRPTIMDTARSIWKIYLGLTLFLILYLVVGTWLILPKYSMAANIFDSINHAMAGLSTGGFSTLDDSIASYKSAAMDNLYLLPMILGAFSLPFYFRVVYEKQFSQFWKDIQTRAILIMSAAGGLILSLLLLHAKIVGTPFQEGFFQFISGITTTGWQTSNIGHWDSASIVFIVFAGMIIGGAAGSTVGGIKTIRALLVVKGISWLIKKNFVSERAIRVVKFNNRILLPEEMNEELAKAATFIILYLVIAFCGMLITYFFMDKGYSLSDALFESVSAQSTVGLSTGITDPSMSPIIEITYILQMWAGRLEIIPILVLVRFFFVSHSIKTS